MLSNIPVVWHEGSLDGDKRSRYADAGLLNEAFDTVGGFTHYTPFNDLPADAQGAVVVVHGGHECRREDVVLTDINKLKWSLVIVFCDDESQFNTRMLVGPNRKIWQQMPIPGMHDFVDHKIICGYPCDAKQYLSQYSISADRPLNWFFSGQVNHPRRFSCVEQLANMGGGVLNCTQGFWQGYERPKYYELMSQAKIIPCPAGPVTPDTIRMAEALEAGCVPIIDPTPGSRRFPTGFWPYVLGETPPFPILEDWSQLPRVMEEQLAAWPDNQIRCMAWWAAYKQRMRDWLRDDILVLQREAKCA